MTNNNYNKLINSKVSESLALEFDFNLLSKYKSKIKDDEYFDFIIATNNGGFFFQKSLHIYGFANELDFHNIDCINTLLHREYASIAKGLTAFAQDLLGNQFCFQTRSRKVTFFNVETGERNDIAEGFSDWINVLLSDLEYLTCLPMAQAWQESGQLHFHQRLCPKHPFIIGGEYTISNVYAATFPNYIKANANIARQIFDLPNGTRVKLKIRNFEK